MPNAVTAGWRLGSSAEGNDKHLLQAERLGSTSLQATPLCRPSMRSAATVNAQIHSRLACLQAAEAVKTRHTHSYTTETT